MLSLLLLTHLFTLTLAQYDCVGGQSTERRCRGFCSDRICSASGSPQISGARMTTNPLTRQPMSCVCKEGYFRENGLCVSQCGASLVRPSFNITSPISQPTSRFVFTRPPPNLPSVFETRPPTLDGRGGQISSNRVTATGSSTNPPPQGIYPGITTQRPRTVPPVRTSNSTSYPRLPNGTYPLPNGKQIQGDKESTVKAEEKGIPDDCPYNDELLCKYMPDRIDKSLIGKSGSSDDSERLLMDTMLANGMTVAQLAKLKPFYRLYHELSADHFYTYDAGQVSSAVRTYGYNLEGISGKIAVEKKDITGQGIDCPRLKPLTQLYKPGLFADPDHFYTVKPVDVERAKSEGYAEEGVAGFCVDYASGCGAIIPLHRFWNEAARDHMYISSYKDYQALTKETTWTYEGVECYIWPFI